MKMVKSLLLGTAAGLVAMTGAQAADLPVKAKPVQYVKICSLYGAGFYYIPGTDMCLKMGGWVRAEYTYGANGNMAWGWANGNVNDRRTNNSTFRARGYITADARNQSEYGTIRSYIAVGINTNDVGLNTAANQFSANRAFIQLAGFTFGISQSFYDFYSVPATALFGAYPSSDTGDPGWMVMAYTAQFGGGLSASISAEERRMTQIVNTQGTNNILFFGAGAGAAVGSVIPGGYPTAVAGVTANAGAYGGFQMPDVVANLRVDQAWGSAQIMGAIHQVNATYYGAVPAKALGHPGDEYGYALGAGLKFFTPAISARDYLQAQVNYAVGASRYVMFTPNSNWGKIDGANAGMGVLSDGVYAGAGGAAGGTSVELTTAWGVNAAYEHFWNKQWKTSAYGGYAAISYNDNANAMLCGGTLVPIAGCDNNWSTWWVGSRTQWNVSADTYLALDVLYTKLNTIGLPAGWVPLNGGAGGPANAGLINSDVDNWAARFRVHKDFYP